MERRTFLKWATNGLGAVFAAVLGVPAIGYLLDPRNRPAPPGEFKPVARLSELQVGVPKAFVVQDVRRDAWTLHPSEILGRVWLVRRDSEKVEAYTTICSHLGCSYNYDAAKKKFICPCHKGTWHLSGQRVPEKEHGGPNPVPRDLDWLETKKEPVGDDKIILVKYQNFYQGLHERIPKI